MKDFIGVDELYKKWIDDPRREDSGEEDIFRAGFVYCYEERTLQEIDYHRYNGQIEGIKYAKKALLDLSVDLFKRSQDSTAKTIRDIVCNLLDSIKENKQKEVNDLLNLKYPDIVQEIEKEKKQDE